MRAPMIEHSDGTFGPDLPDGFRGSATLTGDGNYRLTPADVADRLAAAEARLDAVAALAEKANATATEVAAAAKPTR